MIFRKLVCAGLCCSLVSMIAPAKPSVNIRNAILAEIKKYPELEIQDLYKLAHQAAMGNEHIMADTIQAMKYLEEELASIDSSSAEPLVEYLRSDSAIARINLRSFKAQLGNPARLFAAMMKSAAKFEKSILLLRVFWGDIEILADEGNIPFKKDDLRKYFQEMEQQKFSPVHHSTIVTEKYHPAYRIVSDKKFSSK